MTRSMVLAVLLVGCSDAALPPEDCEPPLPATDDDGAPWPTYTAAELLLMDCERRDESSRRRGSCSDGKRFLSWSGGYTGETYYFADETLVGVGRWTDVIVSCDGYRFGDARCEQVDVQEFSCP